MSVRTIKDKTISAVIACYNESPSIPEMHQRLTSTFKKIGVNYEIIFVNDGSTDDSELVLKKICAKDKKTTAIFHSRNFSSQNSFTSGMIQSRGDSVVLFDGDLQDPPELISEFIKKWEEGYDVVYGIRTKREGNKLLQLSYKLFYRIFKKLSYINVPLDAGDFSLMDKKVVQAINNLPEKDRYIRGLRAWVGFKQIGVEYTRPDRSFGVSTNNIFKNIRWAKKGIFSFSYIPLEFVSYLSYFIVVLSAIALFIYMLGYLFFPDPPEGFTTIIIIVLFLGGTQLLSLGFISEYIAKILEETKNRPKFIIKEIINDNKKTEKD